MVFLVLLVCKFITIQTNYTDNMARKKSEQIYTKVYNQCINAIYFFWFSKANDDFPIAFQWLAIN
jgi:hypothetical protein